MGCLAAAVVAVLVTAASAQRPRSARDEPQRPEARRPEPLRPEARRPEPPRHDGPAPEAIVLRFEHIPAESFLETFHQLAENEHLREGLKQIPIALNEPANAVVLIAPPEVAGVMMRVAEELDHPNEFEMHMHERERAKLGFHLEVEKHKRAMDLETMERRLKLEAMKRHLSGPPHPSPGSHPGRPPHGPAHARPQERARHRGPPPQRGPHGEGGPPGGEPERLFRQKMEELEGHRQRLRRELQEHVQRVHRQLEEIEQHKRRLHEAFQRHVHQRQEEHERRRPREPGRQMQREREHQERERMALREREEHERRMHREREEMERREHQERERRMQREREQPEREQRERQQREGPHDRPHPGEGRGPGPRAPVQGRPGAGLETLLSPRAREALGLSDDQVDRIRRLLAEVRKGLDQTMDRIREAAKKIRPQERAERLRQMMERLKAARAERMRGIHERLKEILRPEQREKIEQMRRGDRPPEPPHPPERPHPPEPREPPQPHPRPPEPHGRPHRPAIQEEPAEFRLIQDFDKPGSKPRKDGFKSPKTKPSKSEGAFTDRKRAVMILRLLQDPAIRAKVGLSGEQEKQIFVLREKVQGIEDRIRDDVRQILGDRMKNAATAAERGDIKRQAAEIAKEAQHAAAGDMEAIVNEAAEVLTPDQQDKLKVIERDRARMYSAVGRLAMLLEARIREKIGISDEQAERIRLIIEDAAKQAKDQKGWPSGDLADVKRRHADRARAARERVMRVLNADQRELLERLLGGGSSKKGKKRDALETAPATKGYGQAA